ncbi:transmembrane protein, putative (macronuclear) [Tetrahymena thermophila SB210]|uniref:Transmembrane protein, putative n=1 Tax=Tetrahymena thermophila (strain SB210) TaxID=312017 RepID=W7XJ00_TETTS|nr:transmembrane protein, putative [Tetrahymena thermophila SB210]EWS75066.1 transmembrane protein, putative [Tetrahymena thermophila SB210]|eukprot:XP_012652379.1 transmembrane protein, putative [Tetrahymena thermophila SB210]
MIEMFIFCSQIVEAHHFKFVKFLQFIFYFLFRQLDVRRIFSFSSNFFFLFFFVFLLFRYFLLILLITLLQFFLQSFNIVKGFIQTILSFIMLVQIALNGSFIKQSRNNTVFSIKVVILNQSFFQFKSKVNSFQSQNVLLALLVNACQIVKCQNFHFSIFYNRLNKFVN